MSRLKNLYKDLVDNHKHQWQRWRYGYKGFCDEVEKVRRRIQNGQGLNENDEDFLDRLLRKRNNAVASSGQSILSKDNFQAFIRNEDFLSTLSEFIVSPTQESFKKFQDAWEKQGKGRNPVLVNRVAPACTRKVSTTVDASKFEQVFNWLMEERIISVYPSGQDQGWFAKNQFLLSEFKTEFQDELNNRETDEFYLSMFVWGLYENLSNPFKLNKQVVKYGPPGTGKTYLARQQTESYFTNWKEEFAPENGNYTIDTQIEVVQFHPSFGYEDFMEGLRPILDHNGKAQLTLQNGVFKEFCRKSGKWEIDVHNLKKSDANWEELTIRDLAPYKDELADSHWEYIFQFQDRSRRVAEAVPPFFFIIDEINRADLSRVFGELMYCLEYRGIEGRITTQYANLNDPKTGMFRDKSRDKSQGYQFFIPSNVYLIGTMNTIDRSVESFDLALRRRFRWEEITPNYTLLKYHLNEHHKKWAGLADNLENLNKQIENEALLGSDYQIGHAYLMNLKYSRSLSISEVRKQIWEDHIYPLLQEYLRGTGRSEELIGTFREAFGLK